MQSLLIAITTYFTILVSCTAPQVGPPSPPIAQDLKADWPRVEWTGYLAKALDDLGGDLQWRASVPEVCGSAKQFYVMLISALARYESGFDPNSRYVENFHDAKGNPVVSTGLLQVSMESGNGYGCGIKTSLELQDPETNLRCGVRIAAALVKRDGVIYGGSSGAWKGLARYWSPFRDATKRAAILAKAKGICK